MDRVVCVDVLNMSMTAAMRQKSRDQTGGLFLFDTINGRDSRSGSIGLTSACCAWPRTARTIFTS
jgi:hypothetical protein